ncbi:ParB-like protein [Variovorax sp. dw_954]|uniref:ParB-like protein n=1 Tax=Variovorax sp. dw_954 TaxID=2720078 RepID=UPI001BD62E24|nr:ParB-like protein [Variovorax sp. dw_954]
MSSHQHLIQAALADLHPTQITVGRAEVVAKRAQWAQLKRKERDRTLAAHWFPAVKGPNGRFYIVDHHHLGVALHEERVESVWVMPLDDLSEVAGENFWRLMEFHRWAHPYDETGKRRGYDAIPSKIAKLRNDPYRSLAGFVRNAGGYAKDAAPFAEFLWADFFRPQIPVKTLERGSDGTLLPEAVQQAVALARGPAARCLPGWTGVTTAANLSASIGNAT